MAIVRLAEYASKLERPETFLALAALSISPLMILLSLTNSLLGFIAVWLLAMPAMFVCSLIYIIMITPPGKSILKPTGPRGRYEMAVLLYVAVLVTGVALFAATMSTGSLLPVLLMFGFIPFQSVSVLALTIIASRETGQNPSKVRFGLAILLLLFAAAWPLSLSASLP